MYKINTETAFTIWGQLAKLSCSLDPITFYGWVRRYPHLDRIEYLPFQFSQGFVVDTDSEKATIHVSMDRTERLFFYVIENEPSEKGADLREWAAQNNLHSVALLKPNEFIDVVDIVQECNWPYYRQFLGYKIS